MTDPFPDTARNTAPSSASAGHSEGAASGKRAVAGKARPRAWVMRLVDGGASSLHIFALALLALLSVMRDLPPLALGPAREAPGVLVFVDMHGAEIARRGTGAVRPIALEELPPHLIDAVVAIEDQRFFAHHGVDLRGLARAIWANVRAGRVVQGGSTITQQTVKNLVLDRRRTFARKAHEAVLAAALETSHTKAEILELYLNGVYFGRGAWGVGTAAERYFAKPAAQLTVAEAALLAGLLRAPSRDNPLADVGRAEVRATLVLDAMRDQGRITQDVFEAALREPIRVRAAPPNASAGYFIDWIAPEARALAAAHLADGSDGSDGIVRTTLDLRLQAMAEDAVTEAFGEGWAGAEEAALIAMEDTGAVRAMVGGRDYTNSQFNRAVSAVRQPGSAFKAFVYAAAFDAGLVPSDTRLDAPLMLKGWSPANFSGVARAPVTLEDAFAGSLNTVAVRVSEEVGRGAVARTARRLGITAPLPTHPSLALGASEVSLMELTSAYAPFANAGVKAEPFAIVALADASGAPVWSRSEPAQRTVLAQETRRKMTRLLRAVVTDGTGRAAAIEGREVAGKTGTTNDFRDAWFIGFADGLVTGVWMGNDDATATERVTGGGPPAQLWQAFMAQALEGRPVRTLDTWQAAPTVDPENGLQDATAEPVVPRDPLEALLSSLTRLRGEEQTR